MHFITRNIQEVMSEIVDHKGSEIQLTLKGMAELQAVTHFLTLRSFDLDTVPWA